MSRIKDPPLLIKCTAIGVKRGLRYLFLCLFVAVEVAGIDPIFEGGDNFRGGSRLVAWSSSLKIMP